ncbi:MAG: histidine phosphatase family protein [Ginsengibacter sp.]
MKTLILVRHAKSSWDNLNLADFDRPLNERGKLDGPEMAKRTKDRGIKIDLFISSPAKRARKTAIFFLDEYDLSKKYLVLMPSLYEASIANFYNVLESIDSKYNTVAVFSHNPGTTDFANQLTNYQIDNMPTCGVFVVSFDAKNWSDFKDAEKEFLFFDFPKNPS